MMSKKYRILVAEDSQEVRLMIAEILNSTYDLIFCENGQTAIEYLSANNFDVDIIISDINMYPVNGIDLVRVLRQRHFQKPILICSSVIDLAELAQELGVLYLEKSKITACLSTALEDLLLNRAEGIKM